MTWNVEFRPRATKQLEALPSHDQAAIIAALRRLADNSGGDVKKLKGTKAEWRLRVGDYRVRFTRTPDPTKETAGTIHVLSVSQRGGAY